MKGEANEYLDDLIRDSADRLDWRLHRISRGRRTDSPFACARGNLSDLAFCVRKTNCLIGFVRQPFVTLDHFWLRVERQSRVVPY